MLSERFSVGFVSRAREREVVNTLNRIETKERKEKKKTTRDQQLCTRELMDKRETKGEKKINGEGNVRLASIKM